MQVGGPRPLAGDRSKADHYEYEYIGHLQVKGGEGGSAAQQQAKKLISKRLHHLDFFFLVSRRLPRRL